jgi:hypothetical protein
MGNVRNGLSAFYIKSVTIDKSLLLSVASAVAYSDKTHFY